jgi:hypothetical protein
MLGWMMLFALMMLLGFGMTLSNPATVWVLVRSMFSILFLLGLLTRVVGGRAW